MKFMLRKLVAAFCLTVAMIATAEAQNSFAYQAVIRTAKGELVSNQKVGMKFSLIYDGKVVYSETHTPQTNQYGNVQVEVGKGQNATGDFAKVPWSTMQVMMKIEADPNGGTNYIDLGTIQLQPAPYAMYAPAAGAVSTVQAGDPKSDSDALFEVKDKDGNVVFAVYPDGVRVFVNDPDSCRDASKAISTGFAVAGRRAAKEGEDANIFVVNAAGTQVFVGEGDTADSSKVVPTGFAVSGRKAAKDGSDLFTVGSTGTQVYINEDATKAISTGFAVAGRRAAKDGSTEKYMEINADGTRIYVDNEDDSTKAVRTGFAVSGRRGAAKGDSNGYREKILEINADGTKIYVGDPDSKAIKTGFAVSGRRGAAKGKEIKLFEVNSFGTQIYIDAKKDKAMQTGFAVSGRRAAKDGPDSYRDKYMVIDADGTVIYVDYEEAKAMRTGFAVSGRKAAKDGEQNTILKVNNTEGTRVYIDDVDGKAMQTGFAVSGRKAAKEGEPNFMSVVNGQGSITSKSLTMQDKESDKNLMEITPKVTAFKTPEFVVSDHNDSTLLSADTSGVGVNTELVIAGDVAQTVDVEVVEEVAPVSLVVQKIDTISCAKLVPALNGANGYMMLKIYGIGLFAPNQAVDAENNAVIMFNSDGNLTKIQQEAAAVVLMTDASTPNAKLIIWPLKQANNLKINFGLMAAGDTTNRYVNVDAFINVSAPVECLVDVKAEYDSLGTVAVVGPKVYGEKVDLVPQPVEGYHFTQWSDGRRANPRTVLILHDTAFASANFEINTYNINTKAENGFVEIAGKQNDDGTYDHGTEIKLTAIADEHYHFMSWTDSVTTAERQFIIKSDTTFTPLFALDRFTISVESGEGGSAAGGGTFEYGTEIELTATADAAAGYHFTQWSDGDNTNPRKLKVKKDMQLKAVFTVNSYTVAYIVDDEVYGKTEEVDYGSELTLREAPPVKEGYTFSGWSSYPELPKTMPMRNVTITGEYNLNFHTLKYVVDSVVYKTIDSVYYGTALTPIAKPDKAGYSFSGWNGLPETMPDSNVVVTGSFTVKTFTVKVEAENGTVTGSGEYDYGTKVNIVATESEGYHFEGWSDDASIKDQNRNLVVTSDTTITAIFAINSYEVTARAQGGRISLNAENPTISQAEDGMYVVAKYNHDDMLYIEAVALEGYYFNNWSGIELSEDLKNVPSLNFNVKSKLDIIANFIKINYVQTKSVVGTVYRPGNVWFTAGGMTTDRADLISIDSDGAAVVEIPYYENEADSWAVQFNNLLTGFDGQAEGQRFELTFDAKWESDIDSDEATISIWSGLRFTQDGIYNGDFQWTDDNKDLIFDNGLEFSDSDNATRKVKKNEWTTITWGGTIDSTGAGTIGVQINLVDGKNQNNYGKFRFKNVTVKFGKGTVAKYFYQPVDNLCKITAPDNVDTKGLVYGLGYYQKGDEVKLWSGATGGDYVFKGWTTDGVNIIEGATEPTYTFRASGNLAIWPMFEYTGDVRLTIEVKGAPGANVPSHSDIGYVTGNGSYAKGATVPIKATPAEGFVFAGWSDGNKNAEREITLTQDTQLEAYFKLPAEVHISNVISYDAIDNEWRSDGSLLPSFVYDDAIGVCLTFESKTGNAWDAEFCNFLCNLSNQEVGNSFSLEFEAKWMPSSDTVTRAYSQIQLLTGKMRNWDPDASYYQHTDNNTELLNDNGEINRSYEAQVPNGNWEKITWNGVIGNYGVNQETDEESPYYGQGGQIGIQINLIDEAQSDRNSGTFCFRNIVVKMGGEVVAKYYEYRSSFNVTGNADHGEILGLGEYARGTEVTLTAVPADGYQFVRWSDGLTESTRSVEVTSDLRFAAIFCPESTPIYTVSVAPAEGSPRNSQVSGSGTYYNGETIEIFAEPNKMFEKWSDGNFDNPREIVVNQNVELFAIYKQQEIIANNNIKTEASRENNVWFYSGSAMNDGSCGFDQSQGAYLQFDGGEDAWDAQFCNIISGLQGQECGADFTLEFEAKWVPSTDVERNSASVAMWSGKCASDDEGYNQWNDSDDTELNTELVDGNGSQTVATDFTVTKNAWSKVTLTRKLGEKGAKRVGIQINLIDVNVDDHNRGTFWFRNMVVKMGDEVVAEYFTTRSSFTIGGQAENGEIQGLGEYARGTEVTLTAVPADGYQFVRWTDGYTSEERTITVDDDYTFGAVFCDANLTLYTVTLTAEGREGVTVTGSGRYYSGETVVIKAEPVEYFEKWSDDDESNPRSIEVSSDLSLTATFVTPQIIVKSGGEAGTVTILINGSVPTPFKIEGDYSYYYWNVYDYYELSATPNEGYSFVGWKDGINSVLYFDYKTHTIEAEFEKIVPKATLRYYTSGGDYREIQQPLDENGKLTALNIADYPSLTGYTFSNVWYSVTDESEHMLSKYDFNNTIESNTVLYGRWEKELTIECSPGNTDNFVFAYNQMDIPFANYTVKITGSLQPDDVSNILYGIRNFSDWRVLVTLDLSEVTDLGELKVNGDVKNLIGIKLPEGITSIPAGAFWQDYNLEFVTIPSTVSSIEGSAFYRCLALNSIELNSSNTMFTIIGNTLYTADGSHRLVYCFDKESETFNVGADVTEIGDYAFCGSNFKNIYFATDGNLTRIGACAFDFSRKLTSIEFPNSVTEIGQASFMYCGELKSITWPAGITEIGQSMFYTCGLEEIVIPDGVTKVMNGAFAGCDKLKKVTIPTSLKFIGGDAFASCNSLETVVYNGTNDDWNKIVINEGNSSLTDVKPYNPASSYFIFDYDNEKQTATVTGYTGNSAEVEIPAVCMNNNGDEVPVTAIGSNAFIDNENLTKVTFADGSQLTRIGSYAFEKCSNLTTIELPNTIRFIDKTAFSQCGRLTFTESGTANYLGNTSNPYLVLVNAKSAEVTSCTINAGCVAIMNNAFDICKDNITTIDFASGSQLKSISREMFENCNKLKYNHYGVADYIGCGDNQYFALIQSERAGEINGNCQLIAASAFVNAAGTMSIPASVVGIGECAIGSGVSKVYCEAAKKPDGWHDVWYSGVSENVVWGSNGKTEIYIDGNSLTEGDGTQSSPFKTYDAVLNKIQNESAFEYTLHVANQSDFDKLQLFYGYYPSYSCYTKLRLDLAGSGIDKWPYLSSDDIIVEIVLPDGLERIPPEAFCTSLEKLTIPASVVSIDDDAFGLSFKTLCDIQVKEGNQSFTVSNKMLLSGTRLVRYFGGSDEVEIPTTITEICNYAFGHMNIKNVTFAEGSQLARIGTYAFWACQIESVDIPNSVKVIGKDAFDSGISASLTSVSFNTNDKWYYDAECTQEISTDLYMEDDGVTVSASKFMELIVSTSMYREGAPVGFSYNLNGDNSTVTITGYEGSVPEGKLAIPATIDGHTVTAIAAYAFAGNYAVYNVSIPQSVQTIGKCAFDNIYYNLNNLYCEATSKPEGWADNWCEDYVGGIVYGTTNMGFYFSLDGEDNLTISYNGQDENVKIPTSYVKPGKTYSVTSIGNSLFSQRSSLKSVEIPATITDIDDQAFYDCTSLETVTLASGSQLQTIGNNAFCNCSALSSVTIPATVTTIGDNAFYGTNLSQVDYGGTDAQWNAIEIGDGNDPLTDIKPQLSYNFDVDETDYTATITAYTGSETVVEFPAYVVKNGKVYIVTSIGDGEKSVLGANITNVTFATGSQVKIIGEYAFSNCQNLQAVVLPDYVTTISHAAFNSCVGLETISIPVSLTTVGISAFAGCDELQTVYYAGYEGMETAIISIDENGNNSFTSADWMYKGQSVTAENAASYISDLSQSATIYVTGVLDDYFADIKTAVYGLPEGVFVSLDLSGATLSELPQDAFSGCKKLERIVLPEGITSIPSSTFWSCENLKSFNIPSTVTSIDGSAFYTLENLENVTVADGSQSFKASDNMFIFSSDGKHLVLYYAKKTPATYIVPNKIVEICDYAFESSEIASVDMSGAAALTRIGDKAFNACQNDAFSSVSIPNSVTYVGVDAFNYDGNIKSINIPTGITKIYNGSFSNLGITSIEVPASVTEIENEAFYGCTSLENIILHDGLTSIGNCVLGYSKLSELIIPNSVCHIGQELFYDCSVLPSTITFKTTDCDWYSDEECTTKIERSEYMEIIEGVETGKVDIVKFVNYNMEHEFWRPKNGNGD